MNNLAIIGLPRLDLARPAIAPAILSSLATQVGIKSKIYDFALKLYQVATKSEWNEFDLYWQIDLKYKLKKEEIKEIPYFLPLLLFTHRIIIIVYAI